MKKHTKIYLEENGYSVCDLIPCEICQDEGRFSISVDIHHIDPKGMGGSKLKDVNENLLASCRECHNKSWQYEKEYLFGLAKRRIELRGKK